MYAIESRLCGIYPEVTDKLVTEKLPVTDADLTKCGCTFGLFSVYHKMMFSLNFICRLRCLLVPQAESVPHVENYRPREPREAAPRTKAK
jgi:hypothetical protein